MTATHRFHDNLGGNRHNGAVPVEVPIAREYVRKAFLQAIESASPVRGDFFASLRATLRGVLGEALRDAGVPTATWDVRPQLSRARAVDSGQPIQIRSGYRQEIQSLDAAFCAGYGHEEYSVAAINYLNRSYARFPSLRAFLAVDLFSAGNILVPLLPGSGEMRIVPDSPMRIVGHILDTGPRKRKPYVAVLGVHFEKDGLRDLLADASALTEHASCELAWLDEVVVDHLRFPIFFICRYCGRLHTCECFRDHIDRDEFRRHLSGRTEVAERVENLGYMAGLCHLCRGGVPRHTYGAAMYYSGFGQRYLPYVELFARRSGCSALADSRAAENEARLAFGFPAIGERWTSETILFRVVEALVAPREVVHHYRGKELEGLELDVWIPELKVGIEYQGEQHYQAIDHWGGEEGLAKRRSNDQRKRALCKGLGYTLIEFKFDEELTDAAVQSKLGRYLGEDGRVSR